ncbi:MAG TPA: ECF-type sigma factor [Thermoanaerobaculia bacterium]|nr:ECF-type sigma factor [Thermoanaerobaculia bacterium]
MKGGRFREPIVDDAGEKQSSTTRSGAITQLLLRYAEGDQGAFDRLVPLVYGDLREIARIQLRRLRPGSTLDTTGLVHEAYLRLVGQRGANWRSRAHFFAVAATAMRQILIDHARYLTRLKRGGELPTLALDENTDAIATDARELLDLDLALDKLALEHPRQVRIVECRYFAGLTADETATALGIGRRTVHRDWLKARAWLRRELAGRLRVRPRVTR